MINVKKFVVNDYQECTHVVSDDTGEAIIIDCGVFKPGERRRLIEYIDDKQLRPVRLLMTHAHVDHAYGNDLIHEHYGLLPEVHEGDKVLMTRVLPQRLDELFHPYPYPVPMPEHYLVDGEVITFGSHSLEVIHVPGHSPGSAVFYCADEGVAFTGDTLMSLWIGRWDLIFGSEVDLGMSLRRIAETLPDDTVIYPGHYNKSTMDKVKARNRDFRYMCGLKF